MRDFYEIPNMCSVSTKKGLLCLWFRALLIFINNCPTIRSTKQPIYYSASSLYMFRVSTTPIIGSTQNCNNCLWYWSYFLCSYLPPTWLKRVESTCRIINRLLRVASRWTIINIKRGISRIAEKFKSLSDPPM